MPSALLHNQRLACWRRLRRCRNSLRPSRHLAMLLVALVVCLGETLLCVVHCQVWLPLLLSQHAAQPMHHHTPGMPMGGLASASAGGEPASDAATCHLRGAGGADVPFHVPPAPVHDLLPGFALALPLLALARRIRPAPPGRPSRFCPPPPLRPPC